MSSDIELSLMDALAVLKLPSSATSNEIRKSYRTLSLLYHPDKAKDVSPETASDRFHKLHKAYELLSDPIIREKLVKQAAEAEKRKERTNKFESERKKMSDALERREQEEVQRRRSAQESSRQREADLERLKEEGRKMREEKGKAKSRILEVEVEKLKLARQRTQSTVRPVMVEETRQNPLEPPLGPLDTTVRLLYPTALHANLSSSLERILSTQFGTLVNTRFAVPPEADEPTTSGKKRKRQSEAICLATFESLSSALQLVEAASSFRLADALALPPGSQTEELDQVWVEWAAARDAARQMKEAKKQGRVINEPTEVEGTPTVKIGEPARVTWWRTHTPEVFARVLRTGTSDAFGSKRDSPPPASTMSSSGGELDFESDVLRRAIEAAEAKKRKAAEGVIGSAT